MSWSASPFHSVTTPPPVMLSCGSRRPNSWAGSRVCSTASRRHSLPSRWRLGRSLSRCGGRYRQAPCHPRHPKAGARAAGGCTSKEVHRHLSRSRLNPPQEDPGNFLRIRMCWNRVLRAPVQGERLWDHDTSGERAHAHIEHRYCRHRNRPVRRTRFGIPRPAT